MRMFKVLSFSIVLAAIATFATVNDWYAKNIRVTFNSESSQDINYQIFYTDTKDGKMNEKQSVRKMIPAGVQTVKIVLPTEKVVHFRIDFGVKPKTVYVSDLKLIGNTEVNILADEEKEYWFSRHVEEHQFFDGNTLRIVSNQTDPYMYYKKDLDVTPRMVINWTKLLQIAFSTFFIALFLGLFLTRKKAEKPEEKSPKNSKDRK